ncbi:hypothetical protein J2Z42_001455 [Clostridium algifaecis]|uniref:Uncharacterized protein n=1 Tax=Clostridium algifaecis TaxID=1472040 RepID=A0ABS4KTT9_9CLOT|nr:hypothetical protein [Clostridium algifaecis]MBP2032781.1 hypothetical protein [Clostridium algifaecis]
MSKHHRKNMNTGFNLGDLLGNIDLPQLISIMSSISGSRNSGSNDQIGSMLNNLNLGNSIKDGSGKFNNSDLKSKLSTLESRLSNLENRSAMEDELLKKIRELKNSPDAAKSLNDFVDSNFNN